MNGPFQTERDIGSASPLLGEVAAADDHVRGLLVPARLVALGRLAPRGDRVATARGAALAAAVRMIDGVHRDAAVVRPAPLPAHPAGLAEVLVLVVRVGDRTDRRHALRAHAADLAGAQPELAPVAVAADELDVGAGRAGELAALPGLHLDIINDGADRDAAQGRRVARLDVDALAGHHLVAHREALRGQDVGELAILVADQRDEGGAVRVVLEPLDDPDHVPLAALEVAQPVGALVPAAPEAARDVAVVVAAAGAVLALGQRLDRLALPQLLAVHQHELAQRRRGRVVVLERHRLRSPSSRRWFGPR